MQISLNIAPTIEEFAAGELDLGNGVLLKIVSVEDGVPTFEAVPHPAIGLFAGLIKEEIGEATDSSLMKLLRRLVELYIITPQVVGQNVLEMLYYALPWQIELIRSRVELGLPFDESAFPGQLAIKPQFTVNLSMPEINLPEQPAPVVNIQSKLEMPATEEVVSVQRDENGFIESATKIRQPIG